MGTIQRREYNPEDWIEFGPTAEEAFARMANRYEQQYWRVEELYVENKRLAAMNGALETENTNHTQAIGYLAERLESALPMVEDWYRSNPHAPDGGMILLRSAIKFAKGT